MYRGRNNRRRGNGYRRQNFSRHYEDSNEFGGPSGHSNMSNDNRNTSHKRGRGHPPGLKGREIGLYYRDKAIKEAAKRLAPPPIKLSWRTEQKIRELLNTRSTALKRLDRSERHIDHTDFQSMYHHVDDSQFKRKFLKIVTGNVEDNLQMSILQPQRKLNHEIDKTLLQDCKRMQSSQSYANMLTFREKLPAYKMRHEIIDLIEKHQVILISGETGCGKTTQVAQFILDNEIENGRGSITSIVCTQPRRISAISVAERVAAERGESLGTSVGFQIRLEKKVGRTLGGILYCTTGILLQFMQNDPALCEYSHIILDEIHERNTESDFIMTLLKQVVPRRPDLKVILMSATMNSEQFSRYYDNCPNLHIPGFTFPVEELYLEDVLAITSFKFPTGQKFSFGEKWRSKKKRNVDQKEIEFNEFIGPFIRNLDPEKYPSFVTEELKNLESEMLSLDLIQELTFYITSVKKPGAILIFLPGLMDIKKLHQIMQESGRFPPHKCVIYPLHSKMPTVDQKLIFNVPPAGVRKIIISTSIAETSITIEDVVYVIDCGKTKLDRFDIENNIQRLEPEWETEANARQRKGRAGRVRPGICYHLYTRARGMTFEKNMVPEMLRTRLEEVILKVKLLQLGKCNDFLSRVMDPPDPRAIALSLDLLRGLNALDSNENLTPMGYHLAELPVDPRAGKMIILGALFSCSEPIFAIAASLSFKDAFYCPLGMEDTAKRKKQELGLGQFSDHIALAEALRRFEESYHRTNTRSFCNEYFLSWNTLKLLSDMKRQFASHMYNMKFLSADNANDDLANRNSHNKALIKAIVCAGLYPNIAVVKRCTKRNVKAVTMEQELVFIHPSSINDRINNFPSPYLTYYLKKKSTQIFLHDTSSVSPAAILFAAPNSSIGEHNGKSVLKVGNHLSFLCDSQTAEIIQKLHEKLDSLLEYKVTHPGTIDWNGEEGRVLQAITTLLSEGDEHAGLNSTRYHTWDNFDEDCLDYSD